MHLPLLLIFKLFLAIVQQQIISTGHMGLPKCSRPTDSPPHAKVRIPLELPLHFQWKVHTQATKPLRNLTSELLLVVLEFGDDTIPLRNDILLKLPVVVEHLHLQLQVLIVLERLDLFVSVHLPLTVTV